MTLSNRIGTRAARSTGDHSPVSCHDFRQVVNNIITPSGESKITAISSFKTETLATTHCVVTSRCTPRRVVYPGCLSLRSVTGYYRCKFLQLGVMVNGVSRSYIVFSTGGTTIIAV